MIGSTLSGRYKIVNVLGAGGMGRTYVSEDILRPGHPKCVVKQLKPASEDPAVLNIARRLFATEAEILEQLGNHDQIPRLLAYFEQDQEFYLVQEFIDGHPLSVELPVGQRLTEPDVIRLLQEILAVLAFIHDRNVIHRDIKPDNIIRRQRDHKLVLIDFGAVKQVRLQQPTVVGQASVTVAIGTPGYMPTEQSSGKPRPSSDIYAVGMIGIQALTGAMPTYLHEDEDGEVIWQHLTEVSDGFAQILTKMVRHYFKHRYQTAAEALYDLQQLGQSTALPFPSVTTELPPTQVSPSAWSTAPAPNTYPPLPAPVPLPVTPTPLPTAQSSAPFPTAQSSTPFPTVQSPTPPPTERSPLHPPSSNPSVPPTQAVAPSIPSIPSIPPTQAVSGVPPAQASANGNGAFHWREDALTTPMPGQSAQGLAAVQPATQPQTAGSSSKMLLIGGGIALMLLAGGAAYALFFRGQDPQPIPTITATPSPTPAASPSPTPAASPSPSPTPKASPSPSPEPEPEPAPAPAPAPAPEAYIPEPEPYYEEPYYEEPYYDPVPAPAPAPYYPPAPAPAPAPAEEVPFFEVPDF